MVAALARARRRLAECRDVEITGTAQHEAWQARALPPVEQLRADLWSIPVPIPHNPLRYVSIHAFALDGGGPRAARHRLGQRRGWAALTAGLAVDRRRRRRRPRRPGHPPALRPPRAGRPRPRGHRRLDRDAPGRRRGGRRPDHGRAPPRWSPPRSSSSSGSGPTATRRSPTSAPPSAWRPSPAWPCPTGCSRTASTPTSRAGGCAPSTRPGTRPATSASPRRAPGCSSPATTCSPGSARTSPPPTAGSADPLRDYLDSLAAVRDLDPAEVLPAHEWRFRGLADRVDALTAHHEHRLTELLTAIRAHPALHAVGARRPPHLVAAVGAVRAADADLRRHRDRRPPAAAGQPRPGRRQRRPGADVDPRRPLTAGRRRRLAARVRAAPAAAGRHPAGLRRRPGRARARPRFAGRLAAALGDGRRVVHMDDLYAGWTLDRRGRPAAGRGAAAAGRGPPRAPTTATTGHAGRFAAEPTPVPGRAGAASSRAAAAAPRPLDPWTTLRVWVEAPAGAAAGPRAGPRRRGPGAAVAALAGHRGRRVRPRGHPRPGRPAGRRRRAPAAPAGWIPSVAPASTRAGPAHAAHRPPTTRPERPTRGTDGDA